MMIFLVPASSSIISRYAVLKLKCILLGVCKNFHVKGMDAGHFGIIFFRLEASEDEISPKGL